MSSLQVHEEFVSQSSDGSPRAIRPAPHLDPPLEKCRKSEGLASLSAGFVKSFFEGAGFGCSNEVYSNEDDASTLISKD